MAKSEKLASVDPTQRMKEAAKYRDQWLAAETEAVTAALLLTNGNVKQAAAILEVSPGMLQRAIHGGRRLAHLQQLTARKRGKPPTKPESIAAMAQTLPPAILKGLPALPAKNSKTK